MSRGREKQKVRVVHNAPGKKGKQEYREFDSVEEAMAYCARNDIRTHGAAGRYDGKKGAQFRYPR